jgi:transcriptional regulator with XRE-family HTH domain
MNKKIDADAFAINEQKSAVVKNLRRIWDGKKLEIKFTQVTAAKDLGWSQGAISHYLNDITELNAAAVIKFANFLDVDPREIDPDIEPSLPSVQNKEIKYNAKDMTKAINKTLSDRSLASSILVKVPNEGAYSVFYLTNPKNPFSNTHTVDQLECYIRLCKPSDLIKPKFYAARLKNKKNLRFYGPTSLPDKALIHSLWSVVSISYY